MVIRFNPEFTDKDRAGFCVRKYTNDEIKNNVKVFKKTVWTRRMFLLVLVILFAMIVSASNKALVTILAGSLAGGIGCFILYNAIIDLLNLKIVKHGYFIEVSVIKKLPIETRFSTGMIDGPLETNYYYPIEGRDTSTGYVSVCYIEKKEYKNTDVGKIIQITVRGPELQ